MSAEAMDLAGGGGRAEGSPGEAAPDPRDRHHRQMLLGAVGVSGQRRIAASHAFIVGCGALGCVSADVLCRAGVGTITLVDRDVVEVTNLQRQTLFTEADACEGAPKAEAARARLRAIDGTIEVRSVVADLTHRNAARLFEEAGAARRVSVILDGTDNFQTRYLLNDLAVERGVPFVYAGAVGDAGLVMTIRPGETECLRCVFEEPPEPGSAAMGVTCDSVGVLASATGVTANLQACEALKIMLGRSAECARGLASIDVWRGVLRRTGAEGSRREECPCCGLRRFEFLSGARGGGDAALCGSGGIQVTPDAPARVDLEAVARRLEGHGAAMRSAFLVRATLVAERADADDAGGCVSLTVFPDGRVVVRGVGGVERARSLVAKYVGL